MNRLLVSEPAAIVAGLPARVLAVLLGRAEVRQHLDVLLTSSGIAADDRMAVVETLSAIMSAGEAYRRGGVSAAGSSAAETAETDARCSNDDDLDTEAAGAHLGLTPRRVRQLADELGGRRVAGAWRFDREAVQAYARRRGAA